MTKAACAMGILHDPNVRGFDSLLVSMLFFCAPLHAKRKLPLVERKNLYLKHQTRTTLRSPMYLWNLWGEDEKPCTSK